MKKKGKPEKQILSKIEKEFEMKKRQQKMDFDDDEDYMKTKKVTKDE